jgi:hypothetical protein
MLAKPTRAAPSEAENRNLRTEFVLAIIFDSLTNPFKASEFGQVSIQVVVAAKGTETLAVDRPHCGPIGTAAQRFALLPGTRSRC